MPSGSCGGRAQVGAGAWQTFSGDGGGTYLRTPVDHPHSPLHCASCDQQGGMGLYLGP